MCAQAQRVLVNQTGLRPLFAAAAGRYLFAALTAVYVPVGNEGMQSMFPRRCHSLVSKPKRCSSTPTFLLSPSWALLTGGKVGEGRRRVRVLLTVMGVSGMPFISSRAKAGLGNADRCSRRQRRRLLPSSSPWVPCGSAPSPLLRQHWLRFHHGPMPRPRQQRHSPQGSPWRRLMDGRCG